MKSLKIAYIYFNSLLFEIYFTIIDNPQLKL